MHGDVLVTSISEEKVGTIASCLPAGAVISVFEKRMLHCRNDKASFGDDSNLEPFESMCPEGILMWSKLTFFLQLAESLGMKVGSMEKELAAVEAGLCHRSADQIEMFALRRQPFAEHGVDPVKSKDL